MIARTFSSCVDGFQGKIITIEASQQNSLPQIVITGLANAVVQESRERVRASLNTLGYKIPSKKLLVHLSPAETKKTGSHFDLPIAMALIASEGFFRPDAIQDFAFLGELNLAGEVRPVLQAIPLIESLLRAHSRLRIIIPKENQKEASLLEGRGRVYVCSNLTEAIDFVFGKKPLAPLQSGLTPQEEPVTEQISLDSILGGGYKKKVLTAALAGMHPLLLEGPPGSGKTLLSLASLSLLPPLDASETVEVNRIYSFGSELRTIKSLPPFRCPHHSISASAFLGGGAGRVVPGELSLAHRGILLMDELPEFRRDAIEGLREPLQSGEIHLHRIGQSLSLPADFALIAAMNPCPCGYYGSKSHFCKCSPERVRLYRKKLSGPVLDRFPLYLWIETTPFSSEPSGLSQASAKQTVLEVRQFLKSKGLIRTSYAAMAPFLSARARNQLETFQSDGSMSFRKQFNLVRLALTLALLEKKEIISATHIEEAWSLRSPQSLI